MLPETTNDSRLEQLRRDVLGIQSSGRRRFDDEIKQRIMMLYDDGLTIRHLAENLNIAQSVLYSWKKKRKDFSAPHILKIAEVAPAAIDTQASDARPNIEIRFGSFYLCIMKRGW